MIDLTSTRLILGQILNPLSFNRNLVRRLL